MCKYIKVKSFICLCPAGGFHKVEGGQELHHRRKNDEQVCGNEDRKELEAAFAGESQARNKYTYFASTAKKEGYEQIAALFLKTADNERNMRRCGLKN